MTARFTYTCISHLHFPSPRYHNGRDNIPPVPGILHQLHHPGPQTLPKNPGLLPGPHGRLQQLLPSSSPVRLRRQLRSGTPGALVLGDHARDRAPGGGRVQQPHPPGHAGPPGHQGTFRLRRCCVAQYFSSLIVCFHIFILHQGSDGFPNGHINGSAKPYINGHIANGIVHITENPRVRKFFFFC